MQRLLTTPTGTTLCVEQTGVATGPLVLALEGHSAQLIQTPSAWARTLAGAGCHVVRVDNRDVGRSQRFDVPGQDAYTLADMAQDVHGLLEVLDAGPAVVCGHSMGGAVAQLLALDHPEDVVGLVLMSTWAASAPAAPRSAVPAPFTDEEGFVAYEQVALPRGAGSRYPLVPSQVEALARAMWARGVDWDGIERQSLAISRTPPWAHRLAELAARCRAGELGVDIIHGTQDTTVDPAAAAALHQALPGSRLHLVPGMGHLWPAALAVPVAEAALALVPSTSWPGP